MQNCILCSVQYIILCNSFDFLYWFVVFAPDAWLGFFPQTIFPVISTHTWVLQCWPCSHKQSVIGQSRFWCTSGVHVHTKSSTDKIWHMGSRDRSVIWSTRLVIKSPSGRGERIFFFRVNFPCGLLFWYLFLPRVTSVAPKKSWSFCPKCRLQLSTHAHYVCGFEWSDTVNQSMVVWHTHNMRQDSSSFM